MEIKRGATRLVILAWQWAIKIPSFAEWRLFLHGLLANMQERLWGQTGFPELCPVVFSIPGGWLVVMRRTQPLTDEDWEDFDTESFCNQEDYRVPAEHKRNSFGKLDGRIVAIDYGS